MPPEVERALSRGVALKAKAVLFAIRDGNRGVDMIVRATGLSATTVLRVADLLCDLGLVEALRPSSRLELAPMFPRDGGTTVSGPD